MKEHIYLVLHLMEGAIDICSYTSLFLSPLSPLLLNVFLFLQVKPGISQGYLPHPGLVRMMLRDELIGPVND